MRSLSRSAFPLRQTAVLAIMGIGLFTAAAASAQAQVIERDAFTSSALTETFTGLGYTNSQNPGPLVLNGVTYNFSSPNFRYGAFGNVGTGELIGTNVDTGNVVIVFDSVFQRVGLDVGVSTGTVEFFDAENFLLNQQNVASSALTTFDFVGFQSAAGIKSIRVTDTAANGRIQIYDNLSRENLGAQTAAPEPGSVALLLPVLGTVGMVIRRRRK